MRLHPSGSPARRWGSGIFLLPQYVAGVRLVEGQAPTGRAKPTLGTLGVGVGVGNELPSSGLTPGGGGSFRPGSPKGLPGRRRRRV